MRKLLTRILLGISRFFQLIFKTFSAMAVGVAGAKNFSRFTQKKIWSAYGALIREDFVFSGLFDWERPVYEKYLPKKGRIGIIGCGAGRDTIVLAKQGLQVEGVDLSPRAVEMARGYLLKAGIQATVVCDDVVSFDFPQNSYGGFIFSYFTYSYIPASGRRVELLRRLRDKLGPEGKIILTYIKSIWPGESRFFRFARFVGRLSGNGNFPERGDHIGDYGFFHHCFVEEEIAAEAKAAGYAVFHYPSETGIAILTPKEV